MEPILKFPASPGTPLFPISPERSNRQQPQPFPQSPTRTSISPTRERDLFVASHVRGNSDVQGKVAQFNNLTKEAAQRRKDNEAALKRAMLGREEAENETRRLKDENDALRKEIEEGRGRERKVGERLESVMEEFQRTKETQQHAHSVYEKEVRRARKEAFKSSSTLVNLQEELKTARNRFTLMRVEADDQRRNAGAKDLEASAAQITVEQLREEVIMLKDQLKVAQDERDGLIISMKEEDAVRSAAEGAIALPPSRDGDTAVFGSPRKSRKRDRESRKHYREEAEGDLDFENTMEDDELDQLRCDLRMEKRLRIRADEQAHLLQIECQFGCCPCQEKLSQGTVFVHDGSFAEKMAELASRLLPPSEISCSTSELPVSADARLSPKAVYTNIAAKHNSTEPEVNAELRSEPIEGKLPSHSTATTQQPQHNRQISERLIDPSLEAEQNEEMLIDPILSSPPATHQVYPHAPIRPFSPPQQESASSPTLQNLDFTEIIPSLPFLGRPQNTPPPPTNLPTANTTTSTVPLKDEAFFSSVPATPGRTISREEALEQIRARRGRARSYAAAHRVETPRRAILGTPRREISAPASRRDM